MSFCLPAQGGRSGVDVFRITDETLATWEVRRVVDARHYANHVMA